MLAKKKLTIRIPIYIGEKNKIKTIQKMYVKSCNFLKHTNKKAYFGYSSLGPYAQIFSNHILLERLPLPCL
jgi:hypothetical protein